MTDILRLVSLCSNGIAHYVHVEIPDSMTFTDRSSGHPFIGVAWRLCDGSDKVRRYLADVPLAERDVDCMTCLAAGVEP